MECVLSLCTGLTRCLRCRHMQAVSDHPKRGCLPGLPHRWPLLSAPRLAAGDDAEPHTGPSGPAAARGNHAEPRHKTAGGGAQGHAHRLGMAQREFYVQPGKCGCHVGDSWRLMCSHCKRLAYWPLRPPAHVLPLLQTSAGDIFPSPVHAGFGSAFQQIWPAARAALAALATGPSPQAIKSSSPATH